LPFGKGGAYGEKEKKLNYILTNPNTPEQTEAFLAEWYADAVFKMMMEKSKEDETPQGERDKFTDK